MKNLFLFMASILFCTMVYSQRGNNNVYWHTWEYTAKEGMVDDFEKAAAKKTAEFNSSPDHAIMTYRYVTGPKTGTYLRVQGGKSAADYDIDRSAEGKYWNDNVGKYIAKNSGQQRWVRLNNGSYDPDSDDSGSSAKIITKTTFSVKADKVGHFRRFMSRISKMAEERNWSDSRTLYRLISGGNLNEFVVVVAFDTYQRTGEQQQFENTFEEDYNALFGNGSFDEDRVNFDASLEYWGETRETLHFVPEMSTGGTN